MRRKIVIAKLLQIVTEVYYKVCHLLQCMAWQTVISKCVRYDKVRSNVITNYMCHSYYKLRRSNAM